MCHLYIYKPKEPAQLPLEAAIAAWSDAGFKAALIYTPSSFCFVKVDGAKLTKHDDTNIEPQTVFEARLFGENAELRWLRRPKGDGDAALLRDNPVEKDGWELSPSMEGRPYDILETPDTQYILWGEVDSRLVTPVLARNGWTMLTSARIGELPVPIDGGGPKRRVVLEAKEYLKVGDDGNVFVAEERLLRLAKM